MPVAPQSFDAAEASGPGEPTAAIRERVARARLRQRTRLTGTAWSTNAEIPADAGMIETLCPLDPDARKLMRELVRLRRLSPRAQHRMRRVARTIADLRDEDDGALSAEVLAQAAALRLMPEM